MALFTFLDTLYEDENSVKNYYGYSKGEYEEYVPEFYTEQGLTEGVYYDSGTTTDNGRKLYYVDEKIQNDSGSLNTAASLLRFFGLQGDSSTEVVFIFLEITKGIY